MPLDRLSVVAKIREYLSERFPVRTVGVTN
jgi:hypothetical protein